jgi:hypothetical protein
MKANFGAHCRRWVTNVILAVMADVGYSPKSDQTGAAPERSKGATFCRTHTQQKRKQYRRRADPCSRSQTSIDHRTPDVHTSAI